MKILSNLVDLIFGKNLKLEAQSVNKNNLEKMIVKSSELISLMNELLKQANTSENVHFREANLFKIKNLLKELKDICSKYPQIYITELKGFEASIKGVETETLGMKIATELQPKNLDATKLSDNDKNKILECIYSQFKVINESIDIARKSKNLDTTKSRLDVASKALNEAKKEANKYSLNVDGFDEAEAEIARITEALRTGAPKIFDGMREIEQDLMYSTPSRSLLKEATAFKKEKRYVEACNKLREAYSVDGADMLMIEERLRLPMYLQLAGKNDEGWLELNRLLKHYKDEFSNQSILKQMQIFLKKENNQEAKNPVRIIEHINMPTTSSLNANLLETWRNHEDVISGLKFHATMQLRTPLRILLRHGEIHSDINSRPPLIATENWQGGWIPKTKSFLDLGSDVDELPESTVSSTIGQVLVSDYLPFLASIREIVELNESIESRCQLLYERTTSWKLYVSQHGGLEKIINQFFPRFIETIPNINNYIVDELLKLKIDTANKLEAASDETLLAIKGIGKTKLMDIRKYNESITGNRDDTRLDRVSR